MSSGSPRNRSENILKSLKLDPERLMTAITCFKSDVPSQPTGAAAQAVSHSCIRKERTPCLLLIAVVVLCFRLPAVVGREEAIIAPRNNERETDQVKTWRPESSTSETRSSGNESQGREQREATVDNEGIQGHLADSEHIPENKSEAQTCHLTCKGKVKALWTRIHKWWRRNTHLDSQNCSAVKRTGGVPSVNAGHSPIESFGYPVSQTESGSAPFEPRGSLSIANGHMQPIRVGAEDYVIRGSLGEIVAFLECFEEYEVIASTVDPDGHWASTPGQSNVILQMQSLSKGLSGPLGLNDKLPEPNTEGFTTLTGMLRAEALTALAAKVNAVLDEVENIQSVEEAEDMSQLWNALLRCRAVEDITNHIWVFIKYAVGWGRLEKEKGWVDNETVDLTSTLTLKISSYLQPCDGARATLVMPVNETTLKDIRRTLPDVFSTQMKDGGQPLASNDGVVAHSKTVYVQPDG